MNGYCVICGCKGEVSARAKCKDCARKAMQKAQATTCLKMILKLRVKDES
jgi:hypothetical protein